MTWCLTVAPASHLEAVSPLSYEPCRLSVAPASDPEAVSPLTYEPRRLSVAPASDPEAVSPLSYEILDASQRRQRATRRP